VSIAGKTIKNGADLWMVGSDTAKKHIYTRLAKTDADADGYIYLSSELPRTFFDGLTSERIATRYVKGFPVKEFQKDPSVRNEPLDCAAYAICAYYKIGLNRWRVAQWKRLEEKVQPATRDLFSDSPSDQGVDQPAIESLAINWDEWMQATKTIEEEGYILSRFDNNGNEIKYRNPAWNIKRDSFKQVLQLLIQFGMTPTSRGKVSVVDHTKPTVGNPEGKSEENKWANL